MRLHSRAAALEKNRGRAERLGPGGPTDPDASRHRGLSKSKKPQVRQTQGVPRAVFEGLLRAVPGGRPFVTFNPIAGAVTLHRFSPALGRRLSDKAPAYRPSEASARGRRARTGAAWTAGRGNWRRISDAPFRPPLPAPCLKMLAQTPLGNEAG